MKKTLLIALAALATAAAAQNQSYSATYTRTQAMDPGISAQLCQNDMLILRMPGPVKSVGVTMPTNVEPIFDGNNVILRGNVAQGRTPVVVLMSERDEMFRIHLTHCPSRGSSTLISIVDDQPTPHSASPVGGASAVTTPPPVVVRTTTASVPAPLLAAASAPAPTPVPTPGVMPAATQTLVAPTGNVRIPAPTTVSMTVSRTTGGIVLTITNGTARTLALRPEHLRVTAGGQPVAIPASALASLAPGLQTAIPLGVPPALNLSDVQVEWEVQVPDIRVSFPLTGALR